MRVSAAARLTNSSTTAVMAFLPHAVIEGFVVGFRHRYQNACGQRGESGPNSNGFNTQVPSFEYTEQDGFWISQRTKPG